MVNAKDMSLDEFWGLVTVLSEDVKRCMKALNDVPAEDEEGQAFWRRMYARAIFAVIDGATYRMMFQAYQARYRRDVVFSIDELIKLENYYDFDEDEEAVTIFSQTQMLEDIKFAFNVFARVHYADYFLPVHEPEWILIKEIARIREALQYPREPSEIEVHPENIDDFMQGLMWFIKQISELFVIFRKQVEEKFAEMAAGEDELIM